MKDFDAINCGKRTPWGEIAWSANDVEILAEHIRKSQTFVLGGDVLTTDMVHTYDSWYYIPQNYDEKTEDYCSKNSVESLKKALEYIRQYVAKNGDNYLFILVLSNGAQSADLTF